MARRSKLPVPNRRRLRGPNNGLEVRIAQELLKRELSLTVARWCFYFPVIFKAVTIVFLFFYMDETMYDRKLMEQQALARGRAAHGIAEANSASSVTNQASKEMKTSEKDARTPSGSSDNLEAGEIGTVLIYEPTTYWKRLALFRVTPGKENKLLAMMTRPLAHAWNFPIMAMAGL